MWRQLSTLFTFILGRALTHGLITGDMLEYYDPELMFTIPRLAIVTGLIYFPEGPLNPDRKPQNMSEMFRPFQSLLKRIRWGQSVTVCHWYILHGIVYCTTTRSWFIINVLQRVTISFYLVVLRICTTNGGLIIYQWCHTQLKYITVLFGHE